MTYSARGPYVFKGDKCVLVAVAQDTKEGRNAFMEHVADLLNMAELEQVYAGPIIVPTPQCRVASWGADEWRCITCGKTWQAGGTSPCEGA